MDNAPTERDVRRACPLEVLETVRGQLVEIEALAHAASSAISRVPFVAWPAPEDAHALEARLNYDRLPFLVSSTAEAARAALLRCVEGLRIWSA